MRLAVGAVLLAAGEARRMGGRPKALLQLEGVPLVRRQAIALTDAGVRDVVVVLGHRADEVEPALRDVGASVVRNADFSSGRVSSVRAGLAALPAGLDAIVVALADQPLIDAHDVSALLRAFADRGAASAVVPCIDGERGNPIVLETAVRDAVLARDAGFGCRQWLATHPERIAYMHTANLHYRVDIDTQEDIETFAARYGRVLRWPPGMSA